MAVSPFDASYSRIFGDQVSISPEGNAFFDRFYEIFVTKSDDVGELFANTDMTRQASMLRRSVYELVAFYVTGKLTQALREIGESHRRLHFADTLWDHWLDSLIDTVATFDEQFDEVIGFAWRLAMTPGITYLKLACHPETSGLGYAAPLAGSAQPH